MARIRLAPMTPEEFTGYRAESLPAYIDDIVRADGLPAAIATANATAQFEKLLPEGVATPGHSLNWLVDATTGARVGHLWLYRAPDAPRAFIYDLLIRPELRRQGYAEAALREAESFGRASGATRLELHVFGHNSGALALYEKFGFTTTHRGMAKPL
jgi:ribosomal protein S18 acetylase RimI-like enzyme